MDTQLTAIRRSELINLAVIDSQSKEEIGRIDQVWLDVKTHKVVGLTCTRDLFWQSGRREFYFHWTQIEKIATSFTVVNTQRPINFDLSELIDSVACSELFTENKSKIGSIVGYQLDTRTGCVISYLFVFKNSLSLPSGIYQISPRDIISIDYLKVVAFENAIQNAQKYAPSPIEQITSAIEFFKEEYITPTALFEPNGVM